MFEGRAEEAIQLYMSLFPRSEICHLVKYGPEAGANEGAIKHAEIFLNGQRVAFADSPVPHTFTFTPSLSLYVECESEAELEQCATQLGEGGQLLMPPGSYGFSTRFAWLNDRFGVSWQLNFQLGMV